jgi:hypothetical protein
VRLSSYLSFASIILSSEWGLFPPLNCECLHSDDLDFVGSQPYVNSVLVGIEHFCFLFSGAVIDDDERVASGVIGTFRVNVAAGPTAKVALGAGRPIEGSMQQARVLWREFVSRKIDRSASPETVHRDPG